MGAPDPNFYNFFQDTEDEYLKFCDLEKQLSTLGMLEQYTYSGVTDKRDFTYFREGTIATFIEDDHIPFLQRNVPVVHVIPVPFPNVWHTLKDDRSIVDYQTVENLNRVLRLFVLQYLNIQM